MTNKKVSILIPMYNSEKWITATIESALNQTYENIEIVIVDDGSTDNSLKIAESYMSSNVIVFRQENKGACAARNKALELSSGAYINYLDADDQIAPDKIACQMLVIDEFGDDLVVSSTWEGFYDSINQTEGGKELIDKDYDEPVDWLIDSWNGMGWSIPAAWLIPSGIAKAAGAWDERLEVNQDGEYFSRVLLSASAIKYCEGAKTYYRRGNPESVSAGFEKAADSYLLSCRLYKEHIFKLRSDRTVRSALARNFQRVIYQCHLLRPDLVEHAKQEIKLLKVDPAPIYGGKTFIFLAKITSFDFAINCRTFLTR